MWINIIYFCLYSIISKKHYWIHRVNNKKDYFYFLTFKNLKHGNYVKVNILKPRNIKVERNHILRLKPGAFHGLENLEILNLRGNLLKGVENTAFTGNHYLYQLIAGTSLTYLILGIAMSSLKKVKQILFIRLLYRLV